MSNKFKWAVENVRELLDYSAETGIFTWKVSKHRHWSVGAKAGYEVSGGYLGVQYEGVQEKLHRLAFLWMTGRMPKIVDHIDTDRKNNSWDNLREASAAQNALNRNVHKDSKSGVKGLVWDKYHKKWAVYVTLDGKQRLVGRYVSKIVAANVAEEFRKTHHGEFARS